MTETTDGTAITVVIPGTPQQQGSKIQGPGYTREANKNLKPWRADAIAVLQDHWGQQGPLWQPVMVDATFRYARPQGHYRTGRNAHLLKDSAPELKATAPDLDKLQRALGDALTQAGVIGDDRLIFRWSAAKAWTMGPPNTAVTVWWPS